MPAHEERLFLRGKAGDNQSHLKSLLLLGLVCGARCQLNLVNFELFAPFLAHDDRVCGIRRNDSRFRVTHDTSPLCLISRRLQAVTRPEETELEGQHLSGQTLALRIVPALGRALF